MAEIVDAPLHGPAFPARFGKALAKPQTPLTPAACASSSMGSSERLPSSTAAQSAGAEIAQDA